MDTAAGLTQVGAAPDRGSAEADPDRALVERARAGDAAAFEALVRRHERWVFSLAARMVGRRQDAEDVAQEVFLKAFRGIREFRGTARFSTWLHAIATNHTLTYVTTRASSRRREVDHPDGDAPPIMDRVPTTAPGPDALLQRKQCQDLVQRGLTQLSAEHRIVLVLRDIQGLSYEAIAEALGIELGTVRSRLHRARSAMKAWLAPYLGRDGA